MAKVKVTLIRSAAHREPTQRRTVKALGLGKLHSSVILPDNTFLYKEVQPNEIK